MDLVSGSPIWLQGSPAELAPARPTLSRDLDCDIVILGAGITGAILADRLALVGRRVAVMDRRYRAQGSTAACTGLVLFEVDTPLVELIRLIGERDAMRAYRSSYRATRAFIELARTLGSPVGFAQRPSLYVASTAEDAEALSDEVAHRSVAGVEAWLVSGDELRIKYGIDRAAAICSETSAVVDPVAFTCALLARAERRGVTVYEGVTVDTVETNANGVVLGTTDGPVVRAGHIVFASGYEASKYLPEDVVSLKSTYAFASRPIRRDRLWPHETLLWETARPYVYVRTTADARVLVGGGDDDFRDPALRDGNLPRRIEQLRKAFTGWFPSLDQEVEVETAWAGTFAETRDGLPYIGACRARANASFALGYGGNGITFSVLAAEIIDAHLTGRQHPEEDLYRFGR